MGNKRVVVQTDDMGEVLIDTDATDYVSILCHPIIKGTAYRAQFIILKEGDKGHVTCDKGVVSHTQRVEDSVTFLIIRRCQEVLDTFLCK